MAKKPKNPVSKLAPFFMAPPVQDVSGLLMRGVMLHQRGMFAQARQAYEQVLKVLPSNCDALHLLGTIHLQENDAEKALALISRALQVNPLFAEAYSNQGLALEKLHRFEEALASHERAIALKPNDAQAYNNKGESLRSMGQLDKALGCYDRAIAIKPDYALAYSNRGMVLDQLSRFEEALESLEQAIRIDPRLDIAYSNRGNTLKGLNRLEEALQSHDKAIAINPNLAEAFSNRGVVLKLLKRYEEALESCDRAIALAPGYADAYLNRGVVLIELNCLDQALASLDKATSLRPDFADAHHNKALVLLGQEEYERGWQLYEWRLKINKPLLKCKLDQPFWQGDKSDKKLLVWGEQGVGDQVLYGGLLPELGAYPQAKLVALDKRLLPLFKRSMPELEFMDIEQLKGASGFEEQMPIGSLPRLFRPSKESFGRVKSPYLVADTARVQELRQLVQRPGRGVCGVSWSSKREEIGQGKSISLAQMLGPLASGALHFVNLQYGDTAEERSALQRDLGIEVQAVEEVDNFHDIDGLAALIEACDVVVTTSNTTAHLAGALGKQTLLLLPLGRSRLWYWGHEQDRSIWYPSIRTFAQEKIGHWQHPLAGIKQYLENELCK